MVQVQKHHLLPILLCFGYIPILILLPSVLYNRGKRYDASVNDSFFNGELFLVFFPLYFVCFLFIVFHILTIFYKNTWTAVLLNGIASLLNLCVGLALGAVVALYQTVETSYIKVNYRELKAIMAGVILLMITQIIGYSSWAGFAKVKLKYLQTTQLPSQQLQQHGGQQTSNTKIVVIILIVSITIGGIGLVCHSGGTIGYTVAMKDVLKYMKDDDYSMFWLVSLYMVIGLYVLLVPLLILTIALPYKKYPWVSYLIAPLNCLTQIFVGNSLFEGLLMVTGLSDKDRDPLDSMQKKMLYSTISVSVGSILLALSTVVYACCWSHKFWLKASTSNLAEPTQHERNTAVEQSVPLIKNEDNEMPWMGNPPYPNVVLTRDTKYHDDDNDDDEKLLQY